MCNHDRHNDQVPEKKYRLADFFNTYWDIYSKSPKEYIMPEQYKAVNAMRTCRTAALGVDTYACEECGEITEVYHSCKNRFCPTCSWRDTIKWAERINGEMLDLPHRHVVFTLPHSLNCMIKENGKHLLNILLRTSAETFKDWISHKYGLKVGIISVLHTFGEQKGAHYHVHMIVSWGGVDLSTGELKAIKSEFVNYEFLKNKFRCKFEDSLVRLYDSGQLTNHFADKVDLLKFLRRINKNKWMLHLEPRMKVPSLVIRYIGRYSKRACLSEYKISKIEGEYISFRYKDYKNLDINGKPIERELTLHYSDFFPRLLQHVPLPYFRVVRYYGAYSNHCKVPKEYLHKESEESNEDLNEYENYENVLYCQHCQKDKEYQYTIIEKRGLKKTGAGAIIIYRRSDRVKRAAA
jgi:hypothetical protein